MTPTRTNSDLKKFRPKRYIFVKRIASLFIFLDQVRTKVGLLQLLTAESIKKINKKLTIMPRTRKRPAPKDESGEPEAQVEEVVEEAAAETETAENASANTSTQTAKKLERSTNIEDLHSVENFSNDFEVSNMFTKMTFLQANSNEIFGDDGPNPGCLIDAKGLRSAWWTTDNMKRNARKARALTDVVFTFEQEGHAQWETIFLLFNFFITPKTCPKRPFQSYSA